MVKTIRIENIPDVLYERLVDLKRQYGVKRWVDLLWIIEKAMEKYE